MGRYRWPGEIVREAAAVGGGWDSWEHEYLLNSPSFPVSLWLSHLSRLRIPRRKNWLSHLHTPQTMEWKGTENS